MLRIRGAARPFRSSPPWSPWPQVLTVAVGAFAGDIIDAARAQTAADAAALASLEGGRPRRAAWQLATEPSSRHGLATLTRRGCRSR